MAAMAVLTCLCINPLASAQNTPNTTPTLTPAATNAAPSEATLNQLLANAQWTPAHRFDVAFMSQWLSALHVPAESQVLVFSKTSLQNRIIRPSRPRALYFSDDLYIGWVPGGLIELAWADAEQGTVFYSLAPQSPLALSTDPSCLDCHAGTRLNNQPGLMVRSVFTNDAGEPLLAAGSHMTTDASPISERWGGWYVTGTHGTARHLGNQTTTAEAARAGTVHPGVNQSSNHRFGIDTEAGANQTALPDTVPVAAYLRPTSDIVALLVLEHQLTMHNLYTQSGLTLRQQTQARKNLAEAADQPFDSSTDPTLIQLTKHLANRIVDGVLFVDAAEFPDAIQGDPAFQQAFALPNPNRSHNENAAMARLKTFDLQKRLFKTRCSYTLFTHAFQTMPHRLRQAVRHELTQRVSNPTQSPHLQADEREQIQSILGSIANPTKVTGWPLDQSLDIATKSMDTR